MTNETLASLKNFAHIGSIVAVSTSTAQLTGSLIALTEEGILIELQDGQGIRFFHASIILDLFLGTTSSSRQIGPTETPLSSSSIDEAPLDKQHLEGKGLGTEDHDAPTHSTTKAQAQPRRLDSDSPNPNRDKDWIPDSTFDLLRQKPNLALPLPDFQLVHLDRDDQQELARWKNKASYAEKVRELDRIADFLPEMMRWTERVNDTRAYLLCGLLALKVGEKRYAEDQLQRSYSLGSPEAALALAKLSIDFQEWQVAALLMTRYCVDSTLPVGARDVLNLGCCLVRSSSPEIPGLASIRPDSTFSDAVELRNLVLAYSLASSYPEAARVILSGDIILASQLAAKSPVFSPPSFLEVPSLRTFSIADKIHVKKPDEKIVPEPVKLFGHINGVYPDKGYGFIADSTQKTYFFHFSDVDDHQLVEDLRGNRTGQRVSFITFHVRPAGTKYEAASRVQLIESIAPQAKSLPEVERFTHLPKDDELYAEAKKAEQAGDLERAHALLSKVIERNKKYTPSAIKDLAQLLSRLDRGEEALNLLDQYRNKFSATRSLDSQRAYILIRMQRYVEAASVFGHLCVSASKQEKISLMRQQAYCLLMAGQIQTSLGVLAAVLRKYPDDAQTLQMIEYIESVRSVGRPEDVELEDLAGLWTGISPFAQNLINNCDFTGLDERSKARGFFTSKDFSEVERSFERSRGRIPRHKAKLLLTLAAMAQRSPEAARKRNPLLYLGRSLSFMGEAAIYDNTHPDTARCYLSESLNLIRGSDVDIRFPLACLLSTYLRVKPAPGDLIAHDNFYDIGKVLAELAKETEGWQAFSRDLAYFYISSREAVQFLIEEMRPIHGYPSCELSNRQVLSGLSDIEVERIRTERAALGSRARQSYSSYLHFHETARTLLEVRDTTRFELDRQRLDSLANIANEAALYWQEQDYIEREARYARLANGLEAFEIELANQPTKMSFELLLPLARHIRIELSKNFEAYKETTKPALSLSNILFNDYYLLRDDDTISLSLELESGKGGAPVEGLDIHAHEDDGLRVIESGQSPELLKAGERRQVDITILPAASQLRDQAFTLRCFLTYRTRSGHQHRSQDFAIPVRIGDAAHFTSIPNPYKQYSGGRSVEDPQMFKGRGDLLSRILEVITLGPVGQCFVLYGQKRSGKTSVLRQLRRHLGSPCMPVEITLGILDVIDGETNFVQVCLDQFARYMRNELGTDLDSSWPSRTEIRAEPLRSFTQGIDWTLHHLRAKGWRDPRIILLIDEFTYIYDLIKDGIISESFMRNWKALLQMECFSAVVVGQDSMPRFKQAFQNEFGSTFDERISYLSPEEAARLAEEPILLEGRSRYRGRALNRLLQLTAGSPFYTHILCDRLVSHLNLRRAPFITEADIERVTRDLVSGGGALPTERFDPLISPDGSVTDVPRAIYLNILRAISARRGGALFADLPVMAGLPEVLKDLQERDVIMIDAGRRYSIRVGLFSEWLQVNEDLSAGEN